MRKRKYEHSNNYFKNKLIMKKNDIVNKILFNLFGIGQLLLFVFLTTVEIFLLHYNY